MSSSKHNQIEITKHYTDAKEFLEELAFTEFDIDSTKKELLYRGHGDATYRLEPSAHRKDGIDALKKMMPPYEISDEILNTAFGQILMEVNATYKFVKIAMRIGLDIPGLDTRILDLLELHFKNLISIATSKQPIYQLARQHHLDEFGIYWPPRSIHQLLAIGQHAGLQTRLLDWTESPMAAAYFAAESWCNKKTKPENIEVWKILVEPINSLYEVKPDALSTGRTPVHEIISVPPHGNQRLVSQRGRFSISSHNFLGYGKRAINFDQNFTPNLINEDFTEDTASNESNAIFVRIQLTGSQSTNLLALLQKQGIEASSLFPDFDGVVRTIFTKMHLNKI